MLSSVLEYTALCNFKYFHNYAFLTLNYGMIDVIFGDLICRMIRI